MRAVTIDRFGPPAVVSVVELPDPAPGAGQVLVRVHAASIGSWDVATAAGYMHQGKQPTFPMVLGWDFAGVVESLGPDVTAFKAGERVFGFSPQAFNGIGVQAELVALPAALLTHLPAAIDFVSGSILPTAALTALLAVETGRIQAGTKVLIIGAAGQVGGFAMQLALARGARVTTSIDPKHADDVHKLGHVQRVDKHGDVAAEVHALIPGGVDVTLDFAGGPAHTSAMAAIRDGGHYVTSVVQPLPHEQRGIGREVIYVQPDPAGLAELARQLVAGTLTARLAETLDLPHARRAYEVVAEGSLVGKVVLRIA